MPFFTAVLNLLRGIGGKVAGLGVLGAIGRAIKWFFAGGFLERVIKGAIVWTVVGNSPIGKMLKMGFMVFAYYAILRIVGNAGLDDLTSGFIASLNVLPFQSLCALQLLGFGDVVRLFISTAASVGTVKMLIRIATNG